MDETKVPKPGDSSASPEISYQVMPNDGNRSNVQAPPPPHSGRGSKVLYIIIAVIIVLILGGVAYYFLGTKKTTTTQAPATKLSTQFLQDNFGKTVCDDQTVCGDTADPDNDGLNNYQEFVAGTKANVADTDGDGIADGDEVNVYGTNPTNAVTDTRSIAQQNNYTDGASIKNGYDPLTPGDKYSETSLAQIQMKIAQFQLHAPTTSTLGLNADGSAATQ